MKEMKIDDLRAVKSEEVKEPTAHEKAAEKLKQAARELYKEHSDIEILRAELKDARHDLDSAYLEIEDLRKTISEMKQHHEAEVQDLKDQLAEAQAMANAANKYKDEVVAERNRYSESLDDDSVTFEEVLELAETMQLMSTGTAKLAKQIIEKMEGRI